MRGGELKIEGYGVVEYQVSVARAGRKLSKLLKYATQQNQRPKRERKLDS